MRRDILIVTGLALLFFFPYLGGVHLFDWDEINFAECSREMLLTGDWVRPQIDFQPFYEKPPLFFWLQSVSMMLFGATEFAARFPNAVGGLLTLLLVYRIGLRLHDRMFAWVWVLAWLGSFLPHFYFRTGIIDPWFNLFIFCGLYGFIEFRWQFLTQKEHPSWWQKYRYLVAGGGILGLAILTKGPTAYLIVMLVLGLYWARYRFKGRGYLKHLVVFSAAAWLVALAWLGLEVAVHGADFPQKFIAYQIRLFSTPDAGHGGFFGYHALVLLAGCFPASVFALPNIWGDHQSEDELLESDTLIACQRSDLITWMQLLFWTALILFSVVQTKIVHYSSICYFPLTYLGAVTIWRAIRWEVRPTLSLVLLPVVGVVFGLTVLVLPWLAQHPEQLSGFFTGDAFAQEALNADVQWSWWQGLPGAVLIAGVFAGLYFWLKNRIWLATQMIFGAGAIFSKLTMMFFVCNIEGHSQRAAIEFYESKRGEPCVIHPVGFKTYGHLFYAGKTPETKADKTYLVSRVDRVNQLMGMPDCHELYRKNGFIFCEQTRNAAAPH